MYLSYMELTGLINKSLIYIYIIGKSMKKCVKKIKIIYE